MPCDGDIISTNRTESFTLTSAIFVSYIMQLDKIYSKTEFHYSDIQISDYTVIFAK